jgi:hypothetical protein
VPYHGYDEDRALEPGMVIRSDDDEHPSRGFIKLEDTVA